MPLATRRGGLCTFRAYRATRSLQSPLHRNIRAAYSSEAGLKISGNTSHHPAGSHVSDHKLSDRSASLRPQSEGHELYKGSELRSKSISSDQDGRPRPQLARVRLTPAKRHFESKDFRVRRCQGNAPYNAKDSGSRPEAAPYAQRDSHLNALSYSDSRGVGRRGIRGPAAKTETTFGVFGRLLLEQTTNLRWSLLRKEEVAVKAWGINSERELDKKLQFFKGRLRECIKLAEDGKLGKVENPLFFRLRTAFIKRNMVGLADEMKFAFMKEMVTEQFAEHHATHQQKLADLRYPLEWFPATRALQRTVHLHIGPTNSGKTYHALQRLEAADSGIYAGPLRLLAHEVYTRLNAKGKPCALITGEERRIPENFPSVMNSCTVEMVPLNCTVDVAVIDEIQMMGDDERGWAWTQAFLGVMAKEVHLCGETRTREIITDLCAAMGDKLVVHEYERLSPLKTQDHSLNGDLRNLEKGDAIILFSRVAIHAMKQDVERITGKRAAVVYGSLPPETRAQQAALFNDPNNDYDYLVASDAVGMGLNLSIKRVIFETTSKHDGVAHRIIKNHEIKQIAGRAGRFKTAQQAIDKGKDGDEQGVDPLQLDTVKKPSPAGGMVTTLENFDLPIVRRAMRANVPPLASAGIFPPGDILLRFANYFPPKTPFSYIMLRLHDMASLGSHFHLCRLKDQIKIADAIQEFDLSNMDRISLMSAPMSMRDHGSIDFIKELANCIAEQKNGALLDLQVPDLELLDRDIHDHANGSKGYLKDAEMLHRQLTLYLWLSYRFAGVFISQALAFHVKGLIEEKINECLSTVLMDEAQRRKLTYMRRKGIREQMATEKMQQQLAETPNQLKEDSLILGKEAESAVDSSGADVVFQNLELGMEGDELEDHASENSDVAETELAEELSRKRESLTMEESLEGQTSGTLEVEEESHDSEDSPLADGNMPTTPEGSAGHEDDVVSVREIKSHVVEDLSASERVLVQTPDEGDIETEAVDPDNPSKNNY
ncbi:hypothetical protein LZ554_003302 [Drepanopeziza brunnea f. sp. 'monogermtubi']|nr:hypothetical protein LZ554_003302 [Drepanopeziza brunnea f. sp. 'monogermtubi']